jgi:alkanesulfonate monooxygenase SsuD/methylene tetrahydromethanopterin reductase-like flavin-dependent oxidoreductase (luciferase family)
MMAAMDDISLGVMLPVGQAQWGGADPRELVDFAVRAEDLGYSSLWVNDSLHLAIRIAATTLAAQREQLEQLIKLKPLLTTG